MIRACLLICFVSIASNAYAEVQKRTSQPAPQRRVAPVARPAMMPQQRMVGPNQGQQQRIVGPNQGPQRAMLRLIDKAAAVLNIAALQTPLPDLAL